MVRLIICLNGALDISYLYLMVFFYVQYGSFLICVKGFSYMYDIVNRCFLISCVSFYYIYSYLCRFRKKIDLLNLINKIL